MTSSATNAGSVHFLIGGARSGKSTIAEALAEQSNDVTYVATAIGQRDDAEFRQRIADHQARRPASWRTVETLDLVAVVEDADPGTTVLIDCLSLWVAEILDELGAWSHDAALDAAVSQLRRRAEALTEALQHSRAHVIVVTNEVGMDVVPATLSGRVFRDELGRLNAQVAAIATRADLVVAGRLLPLVSPSVGAVTQTSTTGDLP